MNTKKKIKTPKSITLVIFGITGDLSTRKLLPAISKLKEKNALPKDFKVIGVTRQKGITSKEILKQTPKSNNLSNNLEIYSMDLTISSEYKKLQNYIRRNGRTSQILFYLSVAPEVAMPIVEKLGELKFSSTEKIKVLLEKPFGTNLATAKLLIKKINKSFKENQIYRIDHYLAKDTVQNLLTFREGNSLFKKTWNKDFIEKIEITASEKLGIEGRVAFYEQTGALRDIVQSHLLELLALTLMSVPKLRELNLVSQSRLKVLKNIQVPIKQNIRRGQYRSYRKEVGKQSFVETFVKLKLFSKDPQWKDVPIVISTGKNLKEKYTGIKIYYRKTVEMEANILTLKIHPDEGITFSIWAKKPGLIENLEKHSLSFSFRDHYKEFPEAYEQVLYSAINGDHTLFTSGEEVIESWRILDPIQKYWQKSKNNLIIYKSGIDIKDLI